MRTQSTTGKMLWSLAVLQQCRTPMHPGSERSNSVTDQRNRFVFSWIYEPRGFGQAHSWPRKLTSNWKSSGIITAGSGRPINATIIGDANQDGNGSNDRLPGARRNAFVGPNYTTTDMRLSRKLYSKNGRRLEFTAESFNLFNRLNRRFQINDDSIMSNIMSNAAQFNYGTKGKNILDAHVKI
jgi:hypothetical protein